MKQIDRSKAINEFLERNGIDNISEVEAPAGVCDICKEYPDRPLKLCNGFNPTGREVIDGFQVCHDCLCVAANGPCLASDDFYYGSAT